MPLDVSQMNPFENEPDDEMVRRIIAEIKANLAKKYHLSLDHNGLHIKQLKDSCLYAEWLGNCIPARIEQLKFVRILKEKWPNFNYLLQEFLDNFLEDIPT